MRFENLSEWLMWIKSLHSKQIDLSLLRVREVAKKMNLLNPEFSVITVAGTNGKGSTVAGLEKIYRQAGYRTGAFSSPFLISFNEQIRIQGQNVSDELLCNAFAAVNLVRGDITLTPFEFTALAALEIFHHANLDVCILEVGLGGRLDAVNVMDADIAIVTSIDIDHAEWLGDTREKIAIEKAGIFRSGKPAISGDFNPPSTLMAAAKEINAIWYGQNDQFGFDTDGFTWNWWSEKNRFESLPRPPLLLQNMACVLMAIELLQTKLPVTQEAIQKTFQTITLPGRIQIIDSEIPQIYDVSHNPASVTQLVEYLKTHPIKGKNYAVFSMLADKDISSTLAIIKNSIAKWYVAPLDCERAASKEILMQQFKQADIKQVQWLSSIKDAHRVALENANSFDRVIVFGSFHTVACVIS